MQPRIDENTPKQIIPNASRSYYNLIHTDCLKAQTISLKRDAFESETSAEGTVPRIGRSGGAWKVLDGS